MLDREDSVDENAFSYFFLYLGNPMSTGDFLLRQAFAKADKAISGANGGFEGNIFATVRQQIFAHRVVLHPTRKRNALKK